jgi:ketosteroid isomerase-like protein
MATVESLRSLLAAVVAYEDKDVERGEVVFDRMLGVGDRVLLAGHRGADRFTSVFTVADGRVVRVQDYASIDAALDVFKRPRT